METVTKLATLRQAEGIVSIYMGTKSEEIKTKIRKNYKDMLRNKSVEIF